jgi:hypothetical protein
MADIKVDKRRFISEKVEVEGRVIEPEAFVWRGERFVVAEILSVGQDSSQPAGTKTSRLSWKTRRHRTWVRVKTDAGRVFDLACDRGPRGERREWRIVYELVQGDEADCEEP